MFERRDEQFIGHTKLKKLMMKEGETIRKYLTDFTELRNKASIEDEEVLKHYFVEGLMSDLWQRVVRKNFNSLDDMIRYTLFNKIESE